jgi:hypothetical protein
MIWPFKKKPKEEPKLPKLEEIRFLDENGSWTYTPAEDITPHEVSLLLPLFINPLWRLDYSGWIDQHNLRRHFTKVEQ